MGEGQCLVGVPDGKGTCPFFSSEKSWFITSKKLLRGLPRYTDGEEKRGQKKGKRENKRMNNGLHRTETRLHVKDRTSRGEGGLTDTARMEAAGAAMSGRQTMHMERHNP